MDVIRFASFRWFLTDGRAEDADRTWRINPLIKCDDFCWLYIFNRTEIYVLLRQPRVSIGECFLCLNWKLCVFCGRTKESGQWQSNRNEVFFVAVSRAADQLVRYTIPQIPSWEERREGVCPFSPNHSAQALETHVFCGFEFRTLTNYMIALARCVRRQGGGLPFRKLSLSKVLLGAASGLCYGSFCCREFSIVMFSWSLQR